MKALIVGLGSIGLKHLQSIQAIKSDAQVYALRSNINAGIVEGVTNIYKIEEIADIKPDFIIISNPTSEHKRTIFQLSEYNIPLFIEKPLYLSLDIQDLICDIDEKKILTYCACNLRFLKCIRFIKDEILQLISKRVNEINVYCGSFLPDWRPNTDFRNHYSSKPEFGGGVHLDLIHEIDYLYWFFGKPLEVHRKFKSSSSLSIKTYDYANYILDYGDFCVNIVLNYYRKDPKRTLELVCKNETWNVNLLENCISNNNEIIFSSKQRIKDTYTDQMKYFTSCIENKNRVMNNIVEAYNVLEICLGK